MKKNRPFASIVALVFVDHGTAAAAAAADSTRQERSHRASRVAALLYAK